MPDLMRLRRTTTDENKIQPAASRRGVSLWYKLGSLEGMRQSNYMVDSAYGG